MINSKNMYSTTNILGNALNASYLRNEVINNNIANVDTPGYKRKDVAFEAYLNKAVRDNENGMKNESVDELEMVQATIYEENSNLSYRMDGNNVDIDTEMSYLAVNQLRYSALTSQLNYGFTRLKAVIK